MPAYKPKKRYYRKKATTTKRTSTTRKRYTRSYNSRRNNINYGNVQIASQRPTVQRGYLPLGRTYFAKLPYVYNTYLETDGTTGLSNVPFTINANCVYDPLYNVGGGQPLQYDIMAAHYERVWVWGVKVSLTFSNPTGDGMYVGYRVRGATNSMTTINRTLTHIQELRDCAIRPINNSGSQTTTFNFYVSNPKLFGITKAQYSNLDYSHTTNSIPAVFGWIEPYGINTIAGTTYSIRVNLKATYYCQFTNPISEGPN